jgi:hypothetical protein
LITVDGHDTMGWELDNVRSTLIGRCGTLVCIGIRKKDRGDRAITQVRPTFKRAVGPPAPLQPRARGLGALRCGCPAG